MVESVIARLEPEVSLLHTHICEGLGDPKRVLILYLLAEKAYTVTEITAALGIPQPTTSHHLKILRDRGLITLKKEGTSNYYSLSDHRIIEALDLMRNMLADILNQRANVLAPADPYSGSGNDIVTRPNEIRPNDFMRQKPESIPEHL